MDQTSALGSWNRSTEALRSMTPRTDTAWSRKERQRGARAVDTMGMCCVPDKALDLKEGGDGGGK